MKKSIITAMLSVFALLSSGFCLAARLSIQGPLGSGSFGEEVKVLPNRNIVVLDQGFDDPVSGIANVGAAHLYSPSGQLISTLKGSSANDLVGRDVIVLSTGNYLIANFSWSSNRGAVTFCSATSGCNGVVSASNSLVGATADDLVGDKAKIVLLSNGNYVVGVQNWDNGAIVNAGAATWGSGTTGVSGVVSSANSLVGTTASDVVGERIMPLTNGNYVVAALFWDDAATPLPNTGAVTFCSGSTGCVGPVSTSNSFTSGSNMTGGNPINITPLANGNYVIAQPAWRNQGLSVGAVTLASGLSGMTGSPSASNSLIGSTTSDAIGAVVTALPNGNFVVQSSQWNGNRGAVSFSSGTIGLTGVVSASNSLVGSMSGERVGNNLVVLSDSDYVTWTSQWRSAGVQRAGAVTWGSGTTGVSGLVSASNSLIGGAIDDVLGQFDDSVVPLSNGNYIVLCAACDLAGLTDHAAAFFARGDGSSTGVISAANALLAGHAGYSNNLVARALPNGNFVVINSDWDSAGISNVGAVTFGSGSTGLSGVVSAANSLVGSQASDRVGFGGVGVLGNNNYVVLSPNWANGAIRNAGAATFGSGTAGISGSVTSINSLVGSLQDDVVGRAIVALSNNHYVVASDRWNNGAALRAGAITWGNGTTGVVGTISANNSFVGTRTDDRLGQEGRIVATVDGNYLVASPLWDASAGPNGFNTGAVTFGLGDGLAPNQTGVLNNADLFGPLTAGNSAFGSVSRPTTPPELVFDYNPSTASQDRQLVHGLPLENRVLILTYDLLFRGDFE